MERGVGHQRLEVSSSYLLCCECPLSFLHYSDLLCYVLQCEAFVCQETSRLPGSTSRHKCLDYDKHIVTFQRGRCSSSVFNDDVHALPHFAQSLPSIYRALNLSTAVIQQLHRADAPILSQAKLPHSDVRTRAQPTSNGCFDCIRHRLPFGDVHIDHTSILEGDAVQLFKRVIGQGFICDHRHAVSKPLLSVCLCHLSLVQ
mmetsp:Transcript_25848/g.65390  ORF Transcript_25848/g.65390 Transcript_25848/m.65390 type:complete len:201 (+) Transcript_25848:3613-4215(+)